MEASLSALFDSFEKLSADSANFGRRRAVVRAAQNVATQFNQASFRLTRLETELNISIQNDVVQANQRLDEIAVLNRRILDAETTYDNVASLTVKRAQCLETLLGYAQVSVAPNNDGTINVAVDSVSMVSGPDASGSIATYPDSNGNLQIQAPEAGTPLKLSGGSIAGKIAARDGGLACLQRGLNSLAAQLITRVNTIYNSACDLNGGTVRDFFVGACASDIGFNSAVAADPAQLHTGLAVDRRAFVDEYERTMSQLDSTLSTVNDDLISSQVVTEMVAKKRGLPDAVSLKSERNALQRYEHAYAVSSQMISALNDMAPVE